MTLSLRLAVPVTLAIALLLVMTDNTDLKTPRDTHLDIPPAPILADTIEASRTSRATRAPQTAEPTRAPQQSAESTSPLTLPEIKRPTPTGLARPSTPEGVPGEILDLYVHLPPDAPLKQPLRVVVALHGVHAHGDAFAQKLVADADRNGWVLVAPTLVYSDHMDPRVLVEEDIRFSASLNATLATLPRRLGMKLRQHVLIYGFSRGAQLGHRFALFYPERVESAAVLSGGTYTLPLDQRTRDNNVQPMPLPFGIADYRQRLGRAFDTKEYKKISFWVAVGEKDNAVPEVPRAFDPYMGNDRVKRATAYYQSLKELGMDAYLTIFPGAGHEINADMHKGATKFLRDDELTDKLND